MIPFPYANWENVCLSFVAFQSQKPIPLPKVTVCQNVKQETERKKLMKVVAFSHQFRFIPRKISQWFSRVLYKYVQIKIVHV